MNVTDILVRHYTNYVVNGKKSELLKHCYLGEGAYRTCYSFGDKVYKFECVEYTESCNEIEFDIFPRSDIFPVVYDFKEFFIQDDVLEEIYKIHLLVVEKILGDEQKYSDNWLKYLTIIENKCSESRLNVPNDLHDNTVITHEGKVKILDAAGNR